MATKYYGINDKWTDDDVENVIEIASEDGTVDSVKVNGEDYGGGGGGITGIYQINMTGACTGGEGYELFVDSLTDSNGNVVSTRISDSGTKFTNDGVVFASSTPSTIAWYIPEVVTTPLHVFVSGMAFDPTAYTVTGDAEKVQIDPEDPASWLLSVTGDFSISGPGEN